MIPTPEALFAYVIAAAVMARGGYPYQVQQVADYLARNYLTQPLNAVEAAVRLDSALLAAGLPTPVHTP